jgi:hypothetical protein
VIRERIGRARRAGTVDRWVGTEYPIVKSVIWMIITLPVCLELVKAAAQRDAVSPA